MNDREVVGWTHGSVAIKWLIPGGVGTCGQINYLGI